MKRTILAISLLLACSAPAAKVKPVMVDTNGVVVRPANFSAANGYGADSSAVQNYGADGNITIGDTNNIDMVIVAETITTTGSVYADNISVTSGITKDGVNVLNETESDAKYATASSTAHNVLDFGAVGDGGFLESVSITSGSATLSSARGLFSESSQDAIIRVEGAGAGGAVLETSIATYISPTEVSLAASALTTVTGNMAAFGTDDSLAFQAAADAAQAGSNGTMVVFVPAGHTYLVNVTLGAGVQLVGGGSPSRWGSSYPENNGTVLCPADPTEPTVQVEGDANTYAMLNNQQVTGLLIQGYGQDCVAGIRMQPTGGSSVYNGAFPTVTKCGVRDFERGIHFISTVGAQINACSIFNNQFGITIGGMASSVLVQNCSISGLADDGSETTGVVVSGAVACSFVNCEIVALHHAGDFVSTQVGLRGCNIESIGSDAAAATEGNWYFRYVNSNVSVDGIRLMAGASGSTDAAVFRSLGGSVNQLSARAISFVSGFDQDPNFSDSIFDTHKFYETTMDAIPPDPWPALTPNLRSKQLSMYRYSDASFTNIVDISSARWEQRGQDFGIYSKDDMLYWYDDFCGGGLTDGNVGRLGWRTLYGTIAFDSSYKAVKLTTGTSTGDKAEAHMLTGSVLNDIGSGRLPWEFYFNWLSTTADASILIGLSDNPISSSPADFIGVTFDAATDSTYKVKVGDLGGSPAIYDTGVALSTGIHRVRIKAFDTDSIWVSFDNADFVEINHTVSGGVTPTAYIETGADAAKNLYLRKFYFDRREEF